VPAQQPELPGRYPVVPADVARRCPARSSAAV
jgi:hypothetical protein